MDKQEILENKKKELKKSGHELYSISKLDTINNCLHAAYHTYVLNNRGKDNVYNLLGSKMHLVLENIKNGTATEADLLPAMEEELEDLELLNIEFPKGANGDDVIKNGWIQNMTHFCNTYKSKDGKYDTEQLFIYETPSGHYLQGYIDLIEYEEDGSINIYDHKTSTIFKGKGIDEHAKQLLTYALGKIQEGYKVNSVSWHFLKYADVTYFGKKTARSKEKTWITKTIERKKIGSEMAKYIEQDLYDLGIDDLDAEIILDKVKESNTFEVLPDELKDKYKIESCILYYDLNDEVLKECEEYIEDTIKKWESLDKDNPLDYPPREFTKIQKNGKEVSDYFFCTNLCGHFNHCDYIREFLDKQETSDDDDDIFM